MKTDIDRLQSDSDHPPQTVRAVAATDACIDQAVRVAPALAVPFADLSIGERRVLRRIDLDQVAEKGVPPLLPIGDDIEAGGFLQADGFVDRAILDSLERRRIDLSALELAGARPAAPGPPVSRE